MNRFDEVIVWSGSKADFDRQFYGTGARHKEPVSANLHGAYNSVADHARCLEARVCMYCGRPVKAGELVYELTGMHFACMGTRDDERHERWLERRKEEDLRQCQS